MEIKCKKCNICPKVDIFDNVQAIRFICQNNTISHCGLLSINNFYKYFMNNYSVEMSNFIKESNNKYENHLSLSSSIFHFIKFQREFNNLLAELINEFQKFQDYFYKILFIKNLFENKKENINEVLLNDKYYYNENIIKEMKYIINIIKDSILIKEEYPRILSKKELISQINDELIRTNKNLINLNNINKDFEYFNCKKNCCLKKLIKFELNNTDEINTIRDRKLFKLNNSLEPACFILSYTKRNNNLNESYIKVYDKDINLLFEDFIHTQRIREIIQLKDNSLLLILSKIILIVKIIVNQKSITVIQQIEKKSKFYLEMLLDESKVSLLVPISAKNDFYLKDKNTNIYLEQKVKTSSYIFKNNIYSINNVDFVNTNIRQICFYHIIYNFKETEEKYDIEIIKEKMFNTQSLLNSGIYFINKDYFILSDLNSLYLISVIYKEIISIIRYHNNDRIYTGFYNEFYLLLNPWVSKHKIIRQINFNDDNFKDGKLVVEGHAFLEELDFYNKYCLIDLEDNICYIKVNQKEEDEIEYGTQYKKD